MRRAPSLARFSFVIQDQPLGLGHAVLMAKDLVGDEPFVVILPDDLVWHTEGATEQMLRVFEQYGASVVAVEEVSKESVSSYGVVDSSLVGDRVHKVKGVVEKPDPESAPSNLAIVGRYILTPEIFPCLQGTKPGDKGEDPAHRWHGIVAGAPAHVCLSVSRHPLRWWDTVGTLEGVGGNRASPGGYTGTGLKHIRAH